MIKAQTINWDALLPYVGAVVLILIGAAQFPQLLSLNYILQQFQIASFLGVIAVGAMIVILLGHIDLSVPWVLGGSAILSTALVGTGDPILTAIAIPAGLLFGALVGGINGIGVAIFRIPSMVWTLAVNSMLLGVAVLNTGGFNPKGEASPIMIFIATKNILGIPVAFLLWMALVAGAFYILYRTAYGRYLSSVGYNEKSTFMAGISTNAVVIWAFIISAMCSALAGIMLAGYANQAYQSMGDPYMLPAIAAVVIGGTSLLGGKGSLLGTIGGVLLITILTSILSVIQISEAWRQIIFGCIIISMLLLQTFRQLGEKK